MSMGQCVLALLLVMVIAWSDSSPSRPISRAGLPISKSPPGMVIKRIDLFRSADIAKAVRKIRVIRTTTHNKRNIAALDFKVFI